MHNKILLFALIFNTSALSAVAQCESNVELASCSTGVYVLLKSTYKGSCIAEDGTTGHYYAYVLEIRNRSGAIALHKAKVFSFTGLHLPPTACIKLVRTANLGQSFSLPLAAGSLQPYELKRYQFALRFNSTFDNDLLLEQAMLEGNAICI